MALVATVNLSAARLLEGHVNAVRLVELYGTARQFSRVRSGIAAGTLLGVWGADSERPVQCPAEDGTLVGAKSRASGLGDVSHALISVGSGESIRLALVDVGDASRQDPSTWKMLGMRATRSGDYDFDGARVAEWIGPPGVYFKEPHFIGGVWRIAAIQAGATIGLLQAAAADLERRGRFEAEAQIARLTTASLDTLAAWELVLRAARMVRGNGQPEPSEAIVALSAGTRLQTERCAQSAIAAVEQSIGLVHFDARSDTGRIARDLAIYLRQAARDALLQRAGRELLNGTRPLSGWLR
ncbi:MAG: acyl-CoA dehydrogenase [Sedimentitalea sp.]|nr:acyl-CoA dehydrogenase [Sedimentitalea sp.]